MDEGDKITTNVCLGTDALLSAHSHNKVTLHKQKMHINSAKSNIYNTYIYIII